jgi:hypothetical protein
MSVTFDYNDNRQAVIDRMNAGRLERGDGVLIPRQEHLVREFFDDDGVISPEDVELFKELMRSNSA